MTGDPGDEPEDRRLESPLAFDWPRLEGPVERDPLRQYDALGRNQPRSFGFMEMVVRPCPWILQRFTKKVPPEFIAQVEDGVVQVPCTCKAVTDIQHNWCVPCVGNCGRWFWYYNGEVRVAYEEPSAGPAPNS